LRKAGRGGGIGGSNFNFSDHRVDELGSAFSGTRAEIPGKGFERGVRINIGIPLSFILAFGRRHATDFA
jgi:hypothetical protein